MAITAELQDQFIEASQVFFKNPYEGEAFDTVVLYLYGPESEYGINDEGDEITCPLDVGWGQLWEDLAGEGNDKVQVAYKKALKLKAAGKTLPDHPLDPQEHLHS